MHNNLAFEDIEDSTNVEDKELRMTLQSLACEKISCPVEGRAKTKLKLCNRFNGDEFVFNDERLQLLCIALRLKFVLSHPPSLHILS